MNAEAFLAETLIKYGFKAVESIKKNQHLHFFRGDVSTEEVQVLILQFNTYAVATDKLRECQLAIELLTLMTEIAKTYRHDYSDLNPNATDAVLIDAVLVDYINGIATIQYGIDYALHADDFCD